MGRACGAGEGIARDCLVMLSSCPGLDLSREAGPEGRRRRGWRGPAGRRRCRRRRRLRMARWLKRARMNGSKMAGQHNFVIYLFICPTAYLYPYPCP
jgi:hypothetical protein